MEATAATARRMLVLEIPGTIEHVDPVGHAAVEVAEVPAGAATQAKPLSTNPVGHVDEPPEP
jgi:hypothetical protein